MNKGGFRFQVLALALLPTVAMAVLLVWFFTQARLGEVDAELNARGQAIARQLAPACEYGVFSANKTVLSRLARAALNETDVVAVTIRAPTGEVLAEARAEIYTGNGVAIKKNARVFRAGIIGSAIEIDDFSGSAVRTTAANTAADAGTLGSVEVELSESAMLARQRMILMQSMLLALVGLIPISLLALRAARSVSVPVLQLAKAMEEISGGHLDTQVATHSGGELGTLEKGVNEMVRTLRQARADEIKRTDDTLFLEKVRAQVTLQSLGEGVLTTDAEGRIAFLNTAAEQLLGWNCGEALGLPLHEVVHTTDDGYLLRCLELGMVIRSEGYRKLVRRDGTEISVRDSAAPIRDRSGATIGMVLVLLDVTQMHTLSQQLAYQASHDPLTGLPNRRAFETRLEHAIAAAANDDQHHVLCYIDLDQFKVVNDTCGHAAGDELLKQLTLILRGGLRRGDSIARLGGDEFGVIFENCSVRDALPLADGLRTMIGSFRYAWGGQAFDVGASIGMVAIDNDSGTLQDLLRAADSACYVAKDLGRNRVHVYRPHDQALVKHRGEMQWVRRLKRGFDENRMVLFAQGIYALNENRQNLAPDYEITVMMRADEGSALTPPMAFIPAAERFNLMPELDRWVIHAAFQHLEKYTHANPASRLRALRYAINVSGQSLCDSRFLSFVMEEFDATAIAPEQICFEITETSAILNLNSAVTTLHALRRLGCSIALDDFGSGLSSFSYLKHLPVDLLKIDGSFVRDIVNDPVSLSMVEAINRIGHVMGLETIAEFVESAPILAKLKEIGVDYAQGFFVGKPHAVEDIPSASKNISMILG